jgi:hypothetical protein
MQVSPQPLPPDGKISGLISKRLGNILPHEVSTNVGTVVPSIFILYLFNLIF